MSFTEVVVEGMLNPDGTLELNQKPDLPPGRVTVVLRAEPAAPKPPADWWEAMQNARKAMEAAGCGFMNEAEVQAHIDWLREEDRIDELLRETDAHGRKPEGS